MLSHEICEIFKNTYFEEHLRKTASGIPTYASCGSGKELTILLTNLFLKYFIIKAKHRNDFLSDMQGL